MRLQNATGKTNRVETKRNSNKRQVGYKPPRNEDGWQPQTGVSLTLTVRFHRQTNPYARGCILIWVAFGPKKKTSKIKQTDWMNEWLYLPWWSSWVTWSKQRNKETNPDMVIQIQILSSVGNSVNLWRNMRRQQMFLVIYCDLPHVMISGFKDVFTAAVLKFYLIWNCYWLANTALKVKSVKDCQGQRD